MNGTFGTAACAAPHNAAAEAGRAILAEGGNAIEAMVAMAATIAIVYPHMNALGGDGFWLVRPPNGRVHAVEACGGAGSLATISAYREKGYDSIPPRGPDAALTVAGLIGGWQKALELSSALGGNLPLDVLLGNAIGHAKEGYPVSASEARTVPKALKAIVQAPGFVEHFFQEGKTPPQGFLRKAPKLAATLEHLAKAGLEDFYRGDVGREIAQDLARIGAPVTRPDLEGYHARFVEPLSLQVQNATLYNFPAPTQGLASLVILGLMDQLDVKPAETAEFHHALIECVKRAFAIRDAHVTDPACLDRTLEEFLEPAFLAREASRIDPSRAAAYPPPSAEGDTVWMGAIDASGMAVSYIQSIYWEYGSGCVLPATGIHWQNRGCSFSLDPKSRNPLQPGRKPFHTLNPPLAVFKDGRVMSYGTMGGDGQPQTQSQIYLRHTGMGYTPFQAVDAPRWLFGRTWGDSSLSLKLENRFDSRIIEGLISRGHEVELVESWSDTLGHAGMLMRAENGRIEATHDPRSDGAAMGVD